MFHQILKSLARQSPSPENEEVELSIYFPGGKLASRFIYGGVSNWNERVEHQNYLSLVTKQTLAFSAHHERHSNHYSLSSIRPGVQPI